MSNVSTFTSNVEPGVMSRRFAFSAAGFIATSTLGESPGVEMSWSEMCTWNDDTPAIVPAGARISAGKLGSVARSLPNAARELREAIADELHAVAGVAGEPDHDAVERFRPTSRARL